MHIPKGTTAELSLVTFEEALAAADIPNEEYDVKKWIYAPSFDSEYRYILGTRGEKPLICVGINPSTAKPGETIKITLEPGKIHIFDKDTEKTVTN